MRKYTQGAAVLLTAAFALGPRYAAGVVIETELDPTLGSNEEEVIRNGTKSWTNQFANGGHHVQVKFEVDNRLFEDRGLLASTHDFQFDMEGRPTSVTITVDRDSLVWVPVGPPNPGGFDALDTVGHEIGHALGFTTESDTFNDSLGFKGIGDRYLDLNNNGVFDGRGDLDLLDVGGHGTHEGPFVSSGGVFGAESGFGERALPSQRDAAVLDTIYGYGLRIPEPPTIWLLALVFLAMSFRVFRR
jgi:hypothetical protein